MQTLGYRKYKATILPSSYLVLFSNQIGIFLILRHVAISYVAYKKPKYVKWLGILNYRALKQKEEHVLGRRPYKFEYQDY